MEMKKEKKIKLAIITYALYIGASTMPTEPSSEVTGNSTNADFVAETPERTKEQCDIPIFRNKRTTQGYLRCIISENPLSPEEARNLPSFTGEERPADPYAYRI